MILTEITLKPLRLTAAQEKVLMSVFIEQDPESAFILIAVGSNKLVAASDVLSQLKLISVENKEATVTEYGIKIAKQERLIDSAGEITEKGQKALDADF